jgi:flagellar hook-associated protein 3 FlgL
MISSLSGTSQRYLNDLNRIQTQMQSAELQLTSGLRVQKPSDDPAAVGDILQSKYQISQNQQIQSNLTSVTAELNTADTSLQSAISAVESAISLAAQGASSTTSATERSSLADQVSSLQQSLVGLSQTSANGRYIFSGDLDTSPQYQLDSTQPNGVKQLFSTTSTRVITDATGVSISTAKTAQDIFDARNPDGSAAAGNVFAAVNSLKVALQNNDSAGIAQATDSLKSADDTLNGQLAFYGAAENRVTDATALAQKFQLQQTTQLSGLQDTDVASAAMQLSQTQLAEQAAMSAESRVMQDKNLFSYLG